MHFSHINDGGANKATKFAVVAGLHVLVGVAFVHALNSRHISIPKMEEVMVLLQPDVPPPPPPPEPPKPMPKTAPPEVVVPKVEVEVTPPDVPPPVQAVVETEATPEPTPAPVQAEAPPAQPSANTGQMRTAVLADAAGCATPAYPPNAMRNGDSGTVTLALLVGVDGKVTSSRIQQSSGFPELDRAAVRALSMCKFKPAMNNGVPEAGWGRIAYDWKLD